jgi:hypothetical protein
MLSHSHFTELVDPPLIFVVPPLKPHVQDLLNPKPQMPKPIFLEKNCTLTTWSKSKSYMHNANPTPTQPQIIIQKFVIVIIQNPIFFFTN